MTFYLKQKKKNQNTRRNNLQRKILHKNKNWLDRTCCVTWCRQMTCIQRAHSLIAHLFQRNDFSNSFLISIPTDYILSSSNAGFAFDCMFRDGHRCGCQCPHGEHGEHRRKKTPTTIWKAFQFEEIISRTRAISLLQPILCHTCFSGRWSFCYFSNHLLNVFKSMLFSSYCLYWFQVDFAVKYSKRN